LVWRHFNGAAFQSETIQIKVLLADLPLKANVRVLTVHSQSSFGFGGIHQNLLTYRGRMNISRFVPTIQIQKANTKPMGPVLGRLKQKSLMICGKPGMELPGFAPILGKIKQSFPNQGPFFWSDSKRNGESSGGKGALLRLRINPGDRGGTPMTGMQKAIKRIGYGWVRSKRRKYQKGCPGYHGNPFWANRISNKGTPG
jgi:hypothetical protein